MPSLISNSFCFGDWNKPHEIESPSDLRKRDGLQVVKPMAAEVVVPGQRSLVTDEKLSVLVAALDQLGSPFTGDDSLWCEEALVASVLAHFEVRLTLSLLALHITS
jgi:hypothetical protein